MRILQRLGEEEPDEVLMGPMCRLWSPMRNLNIAQSEEYRVQLEADRQEHRDAILIMCSAAFQEQACRRRRARIEHHLLSRVWGTWAFEALEDLCYDVYVGQCMCMDLFF